MALIEYFVATLAGVYSGKTLHNYVAGVRAWHIVHRQPWVMNKAQLDSTLKGAEVLTPESSKRPPRDPCTVDILERLIEKLDPDNPLDAAVIACCTSLFYGIARSGELTVPNLKAFNARFHVKISDVRESMNEDGTKVTVMHVPRTKTNQLHGENVFWARQGGPTCPENALNNQIRINNPQPNKHLFSYSQGCERRLLTKTIFIKALTRAATEAGIPPLQGHAFRIGGTLEYLLRGFTFEIVKIKGRWTSDAFLTYLRRHAEVMAPYMQAKDKLHMEFFKILSKCKL